MGLFYSVATTGWYKAQVFEPYVRLSAQVSGELLGLLGQRDVVVRGVSIASPAYAISIAEGCDGLEATALFVALVLAFPAPLIRKVPAILVGAALLIALNLARIVSLFLIGAFHPRWFHVMHVEVWQVVFILVAIAFWAGWLQWATGSLATRTYAPG